MTDTITPPDEDEGTTPPPADEDEGTTPPPADEDEGTTPPPADEDEGTTPPPADEDTFSRAYVDKLRSESARYRTRAARADQLSRDLMAARIRADGRLSDPDLIPWDADYEDAEKLDAAITALLDKHPGLSTRGNRADPAAGRSGGEGTDMLTAIRAITGL